MSAKWVVGQRVWRHASMNSTPPPARRPADWSPWTEVTICKVGRKYVFVEGAYGRATKYDAETGVEVTQYSGSATSITDDEGKARRDREHALNDDLLRLRVLDLRQKGFSLETLEQVVTLLNADVATRA